MNEAASPSGGNTHGHVASVRCCMSCLPARRCASVPRVRRRSLRATKRAWASLAAVCVGLHPSAARAADAEVHASSVTFDAGRGELLLEGDVRVDSPPFHLRSHRVSLRRVGGGPLDVKGEGTLAFCPCLGAPLSVTFQGAKVAPPADLFLERPTLALYGLPVLWLPAFWLRAPSRPGLLPPDLAYRGSDGLYGGLGGHLPWHRASGEIGALDLRLGGYTRGGGVVDARLLSPTSQTHVRVDHLTRTGLSVDARGFGAGALAPVSWDLDLLRGDRALVATTRLDDAARPWDRASIEATWAPGWGRVTGGAESALPRGGSIDSLGATGPVVGLARAACPPAVRRRAGSTRPRARCRRPARRAAWFTLLARAAARSSWARSARSPERSARQRKRPAPTGPASARSETRWGSSRRSSARARACRSPAASATETGDWCTRWSRSSRRPQEVCRAAPPSGSLRSPETCLRLAPRRSLRA